jgi:prepilin-type N-terminal cleavage/methylation domain-containing protein
MRSLLNRLKAQEGFTLIEILATILITGILIVVAFYFVNNIFNSDIRSTQDLNERDGVARAAEYFSLSLGPTVTGSLGEPCGQYFATACPSGSSVGSIIPSTVSGDQLVFTSGQTCYRVYYDATKKELSEAVASPTGSSCDSIAPPGSVAGPNGDPASSTDPVLNGPISSASLLNATTNNPLQLNVVNNQVDLSANTLLESKFSASSCASPPSGTKVPVFVYLDSNENLLCPNFTNSPDTGVNAPDNTALSSSTNPWYQSVEYGNQNGANKIAAVLVTIYGQVVNATTAPQLVSQEIVDLNQPVSHSPINTILPSITDSTTSGAFTVGDILTGSSGTWDAGAQAPPPNYSYQWEYCTPPTNNPSDSNCAPISGSGTTSSSYTLTSNDSGHTIRLVVTDTGTYGSVEATSPSINVVG